MKTIELCRNSEWFAEHYPWIARNEDLFTMVTEQIRTRLWDMGFEVISPRDGRITMHGWNGAVMRWKYGLVGTFAELSSKEKMEIEKVVDSAYKENYDIVKKEEAAN